MQLLIKENDDSDDKSSASLIADSDDCLRKKLVYRKKNLGRGAVEPHYDIVFEIENKFVQKCNDHKKYKLSYKDTEASYEMNDGVSG
uniref:HUN domain-containing protein n=1 Tax=Strongyloides papillosus TaxID=174720 RepID=A0A0N5C8X5_STREA